MITGERYGKKYWIHPLVPDEVKVACKDALEQNESLIPSWCNEVRIYWDSEGDQTDHGEGAAAAYMEASYAYRYASITICPPFLSEEPRDRESRIRHELCHIVTYPLILYVKNVAETLTNEEEVTAQLIRKELSEKIESMTEDLVQIISNIENDLSSKSSKK